MPETASRPVPKIASLKTFAVRMPFVDGGAGTGGTPSRWHELDMVLVRVEDEDGHVGWGEAFAYFCLEPVRAAVERMIAPFVVGERIDDIAAWNMGIQKKLHLFGRYGITLFALSGVDIALWDLAAKRQGLPLWRLFGAAENTERPAYASLVRYGDADLVAQQCRRALDLGYRLVKLHEVEPAVIARARQAIGTDVPLMVDANCAWSVEEAKALAPVFRENNVFWVEEPVFPPDDYAAMIALEAAGIPVGTGENASTAFDFSRVIQSVSYPQPSMTKAGGVSEFIRITEACRVAGKTPMPHTPYFGPGYFATLALLPLMPAQTLVEYLFVDPEAWIAETPRPEGGKLRSSSRSGIGFAPDPEVLERYAVKS
ncbi:mandelate racemase/muconate lactonizing enzyme family protein [Agrobacterium tumefaciens]|uniref:mandelate racemase/muconate lactonizing enzyme family protein n=1 Tax=Agrobacterium tumefaciens TaxID=358 RepID=UPI0021D37B07|nr:mandelate racemase/muconate lactonizing enzyme family protein [Agrobacterium tumefaciens]UXT51463.1 mandelate racemase/muconate lactonizing enzyme family protein [Agrobacterium tumefaciens]